MGTYVGLAGCHALTRGWPPLDLTIFGVGVIIGAGIFVYTGLVAATNAGPAIALSFLVAGLACALAALCCAEFASTVRSPPRPRGVRPAHPGVGRVELTPAASPSGV